MNTNNLHTVVLFLLLFVVNSVINVAIYYLYPSSLIMILADTLVDVILAIVADKNFNRFVGIVLLICSMLGFFWMGFDIKQMVNIWTKMGTMPDAHLCWTNLITLVFVTGLYLCSLHYLEESKRNPNGLFNLMS